MWWCIVKEDYETFYRHTLNKYIYEKYYIIGGFDISSDAEIVCFIETCCGGIEILYIR